MIQTIESLATCVGIGRKTSRGKMLNSMSETDWDHLNLDEFRDALAKGLGRALMHAQRRMTNSLLSPIEETLTHNLAYDPQCEGGRDEYLLELADAAGGLVRFRDAIIQSLPRAENYWDASQLFTLSRQLATKGDAQARAAIYEVFHKSVKDERDWPGALDIVELDGTAGVADVARTFGQQMMQNPNYPADDFRWFTTSDLGKGAIERLLIDMSKSDPHIRCYIQKFDQPSAKPTTAPRPTDEDLQTMTFEDVLSLPVARQFIGPYAFRRWGRLAGFSEALEAANRIATEQDPDVMRLLLTSFYERPFEGEPQLLLSVLDRFAGNDRVTRAAEVALQNVESDEVRAAALELIESRQDVCRGLMLLCANYQHGDWDLILAAIREANLDRDQRHDAGHWLLDLFDAGRTNEEPGAMLWTYENTPCSNCRGSAFERLHEASQAPEWMYREMLKDSRTPNRQMASRLMRDDNHA